MEHSSFLSCAGATRRAVIAAAITASVQGVACGQVRGSPSLASRLAAYADSLDFASLDPPTIEAVKAHMIDAVGCGIAALDLGPVRTVRMLAKEQPGPCTLLGSTDRCSVEWASFANGCALRELDLNDFYTGKDTGHPSDCFAACLAVGEANGRSGRDVMVAAVIAYEVICRFLDGPSLRARGFDHPAFSLAAVALAAGKLMGLSRGQLEQAVNIAVAAHIPLFQTRSETFSNWKGMADPEAARNAVFAALLARGGVSGPRPIYEGKAGFAQAVSGPFDLDVSSFGGGSGSFRINAVRFKFYPVQAFIQTAVPPAALLHRRIGSAGIRRVAIATTRLGREVAANGPEKWAPRTAETADHSLPYVVARTLLDGELTVRSFSEAALADERVKAILAAVTVTEDPALTALMPDRMPNRVSVTLDTGAEITAQADDLPGFPGRPMRREDVGDKFRSNVGAFWPKDRRDRLLDALWTFEDQTDLTAFMARFARVI